MRQWGPYTEKKLTWEGPYFSMFQKTRENKITCYQKNLVASFPRLNIEIKDQEVGTDREALLAM